MGSQPCGQHLLPSAAAKWQHLCSLLPDPGEQFWPCIKRKQKRQGQKTEAHAPAESSYAKKQQWKFLPMQVLGHSSQGDQGSSAALHLSLWVKQQESTWEGLWILLDNFSGVYCHVKITWPMTSSGGHPLHGETAAISGHQWHGFKYRSRQQNMQKNQKPSSEASLCPCCPHNELLNPSFKKNAFWGVGKRQFKH